jgi:putative phage-type endonuclease
VRIICTTQGTPEWHAARAGHITASAAWIVLSQDAVKSRAGYRLQLCLDLEGVEDWSSQEPEPWFIHGRQWEAWARGWYAYRTDQDIEQTGFVEHDDHHWLGCSPDGLTPDIALEIKCHKSLRQFQIAKSAINRRYADQAQVVMLVTGRPACALIHYWRNEDTGELLERGHVHTIPADPARQAYFMERAAAFYIDVLRLYRERNPHREP